ncbi:MAG: flippase [Anaerolineaceae bacterium]|nr:flippase [Anaerolineaceae bacterium]
MNSNGRTIARNAGILMGSQLINWVLALIVTIVVPRYLGAAIIGKYQLAGSLLVVIGIIASFGMERLLTKEVARNHAKIGEIFGTISILRVGMYLIGYVILGIYIYFLKYPVDTIYIILIFLVSYIIDQMASLYMAALQGVEKMEYMSLSAIICKTFSVVASLLLVFLKQSVYAIAAVSIGTALINLIIVAWATHRMYKIPLRFNPAIVKWLYKSSLPYLLSTVFLVVYMRIDIIILSWLTTEKEIGWYGASSTLFGTMLFVPTIFMTAVFPALARMYVSGADATFKVLRKSLDLLLIIGIPIGLGVFAIADPLVVLLYGADFAGSGPILAIMGIVLIFTYLTILLGQYLVSIDRQVLWTWVMAIATFATVPLDLLFIPWCRDALGNGAIGGAISFVITELGMVIAGFVFLPKGLLEGDNIRRIIKTLVAGLIMTAVVWQLRQYFIAIPILVGGVIYVGAILLFRVVPQDDWALLKSLGLGLLARFSRGKIRPSSINQ